MLIMPLQGFVHASCSSQARLNLFVWVACSVSRMATFFCSLVYVSQESLVPSPRSGW